MEIDAQPISPPISPGLAPPPLPRIRRVPTRFDDYALNTREQLTQLQRSLSPSPPASASVSPFPTPPPTVYHSTTPDKWGLYRRYHEIPSHFSDEALREEFQSVAPAFHSELTTANATTTLSPPPSSAPDPAPFYFPFDNPSRWRLCKWSYEFTTSMGSTAAANSLVRDVIKAPDFDAKHFPENFNIAQDLKRLEAEPAPALSRDDAADEKGYFQSDGRWKESSVEIPLACHRHKFKSESHAPKLRVGGIMHRDLLSLVKDVYESPTFYDLHLKPFTQMWKPSAEEAEVRVHWEAYSSDAVLELEEELRRTLPPPELDEAKLESVIVPIQVYSDSAHLADFGTASVWPIYAFIVSLSKYLRSNASLDSALHWAYIPTVCISYLTALYVLTACLVAAGRC
jgi:hypothetical protein